jgi:hypothetical protein
MVKTNNKSNFVLLTLDEIRKEKENVILQIEDTNSKFSNGQECYLCEIVDKYSYSYIRGERELMDEICRLNEEKRGLERKIQRLEKALLKERERE